MTPPEPTEPAPSAALMDLAFAALDDGMATVVRGGGPLPPFCMVDVAGQRSLDRFFGDLEEGQAKARARVRATSDVSLAAVAWDGYLTRAERLDAVFVEASEAGDPRSVLIAQQYKATGTFRKRYAAEGNPVLLKRGPSLLSN